VNFNLKKKKNVLEETINMVSRLKESLKEANEELSKLIEVLESKNLNDSLEFDNAKEIILLSNNCLED
jgi:hypothetical protein